MDVDDFAKYKKGSTVETRLGFGTVVGYENREDGIKYRVDVERRGDSFVFFGHEIEEVR